tara:strand:- start:4005 stop:5021 length:1017 start_codon:yes stop_codon:yes gene_type:complete
LIKKFFLKPTKTFIIAEIGSNHNQSLAKAKKLIKLSAKNGADAVKFQYLNFKDMYTDDKRFKKEKEIFKKVCFPESWIPKLNKYSKKLNIIFFFSITSFSCLKLAIKYKIPILKIASPQFFSNPWLIEACLRTGKKVILSTGLSSFKEIKKRIESLKNKKLTKNSCLLYCDSRYPLEIENFDYKQISLYKQKFNLPVGLSDHTLSTMVPAISVFEGAEVIEKHITLNRKDNGPDHFFSLEINEFSEMVKNIREVEKIIFTKKFKKKSLNNKYRKLYQIKCIADKDYKINDKLNGIKKSGLRSVNGINIEMAEKLENNYTVKKNIKKDDIINFSKLKKR